MRTLLKVGIFVLSGLATASPEFVPLQEKAQGGALAGASQLNDSLYTNPAGSSFTQVYALDGIFQMPKTFAVSVLDTRTSGMGGALGYFRKQVGSYEQPLQGAKLGLCGKVSDSIGFGVAGKMLWGPNLAGDYTKLNDIDTGLLGTYSFLQFGVALRNTLGGDVSMDQGREWTAGARAGWEDTLYLSVATVSHWEAVSPYQYGAGVEYVSPYYFSLKAGYRTQPRVGQNFWSAGFSFLSPRLSLHYAVEFPQQAGSKTEHLLGVTLLM